MICEACGNEFREDEGSVYPIKAAPWMCKKCTSKREKTRVIEVHSYKPNPIFHGTGRQFGVEIEVELKDGVRRDRTAIAKILKDACPIKCYIKEDASLLNGFEIVTHPASLKIHADNAMADWIAIVSSFNKRTTTASIHVHAQKGVDVNTEKYIGTLARFYCANKKALMLYSGRMAMSSFSQYAKFDREYIREYNHHGVIHVREQTVEHRLFGNNVDAIRNYVHFVARIMDDVDAGIDPSRGHIEWLMNQDHDPYFYHTVYRMSDEEVGCV
jgi:hypothetical protein